MLETRTNYNQNLRRRKSRRNPKRTPTEVPWTKPLTLMMISSRSLTEPPTGRRRDPTTKRMVTGQPLREPGKTMMEILTFLTPFFLQDLG